MGWSGRTRERLRAGREFSESRPELAKICITILLTQNHEIQVTGAVHKSPGLPRCGKNPRRNSNIMSTFELNDDN